MAKTNGNTPKTAIPKEADYARAIVTACPPGTWQQIIQKQVDMALAGDTRAAAFLAKYLLNHMPRLSSDSVQGKVDPIERLLAELR